jgi:hypothetical protein
MTMGEVVGTALAILLGVAAWAAIGYGLWRAAQMKPDPSTVRTQIQATRAILKFCVDHHDDRQVPIGHIRDCLNAIEGGKLRAAVDGYRRISWGPYGFSDWWPPVIFEHEDKEYVCEVFQALCERWHRLMELLCQKHRAP